MPARTPYDIHPLFVNAMNAEDLDALVALYEPQGTLVPQPGEVVTGTEAIRQGLQGFLAMKPTIRIETRHILQTGDLALLRSQWTIDCTGPDGRPVKMAGNGTEVARRQADGTWLLVIDHPFGAD